MRCIYKVLFTRVHPRAEKVNAWGKCSPRCSPFGNCQQSYDKRAILEIENQLVKSAKHIYSEKATYHELTEGMRAWVLKKSDIKKAFHLTRSFESVRSPSDK